MCTFIYLPEACRQSLEMQGGGLSVCLSFYALGLPDGALLPQKQQRCMIEQDL